MPFYSCVRTMIFGRDILDKLFKKNDAGIFSICSFCPIWTAEFVKNIKK